MVCSFRDRMRQILRRQIEVLRMDIATIVPQTDRLPSEPIWRQKILLRIIGDISKPRIGIQPMEMDEIGIGRFRATELLGNNDG